MTASSSSIMGRSWPTTPGRGLRARLPTNPARRYEISGAIDSALLADLQSRGIEATPIEDASLEQVFLHLTGKALRDAS